MEILFLCALAIFIVVYIDMYARYNDQEDEIADLEERINILEADVLQLQELTLAQQDAPKPPIHSLFYRN